MQDATSLFAHVCDAKVDSYHLCEVLLCGQLTYIQTYDNFLQFLQFALFILNMGVPDVVLHPHACH